MQPSLGAPRHPADARSALTPGDALNAPYMHVPSVQPLGVGGATSGRATTFAVSPPVADSRGARRCRGRRGAQAFADLATISVLQQQATTETQRVNEQLSHALTSRIIIEQAKGVVFERAGVDMSEAFARLRSYARGHNQHLTAVAQAAIDGTLGPQAWATTPRSS